MSAKNGDDAEDQLTDSTLFDFLCSETEERDDFNHDIYHFTRHGRALRWRDGCVNFQPGEKAFYLSEDPDESSSASADTSGSLEIRESGYRHGRRDQEGQRPKEERQHLQR
jgi:hypothetical protein